MNYNRSVRCEVCRKFIGYSDFVRGEVTIIKSITTGNESRITYCHSKCLNSPEMISPVIGEAIRVCSDVFDIEAGLVIGRTRQKKAVFARHMAIALSFELFKRNGQRVTYSMVGYEFGRRDHTTVLHSKRTFVNLYETDGWFREKADFCRVELGLERTEKLCPDCGKPVQHEMLGRCNGCYALKAVDLHNRIFPAVQELKAELKEKSISLDMKELRSKLNEAILAYCEAFAAKQGLTFETFNKHLGVANFGGNYFELKDVLFDIDTNQPSGAILDWQNDVEHGISISYPAFCHVSRPIN